MTTTSATSSATSQLITALGAGSGIDMAGLATNLAAAQFAARTDRLTTKSETLDRQISAASNLKSMILSLATSLGDRVRMGDLSPQPQIANSAIARLSLTGTVPPKGTYGLEVTALARGEVLTSPAYAAATATSGSGTLTIRFGTVTPQTTSAATTVPGSFSADAARAPLAVSIAQGATLTDIANAINAAGTAAGAGLSAYVAATPEGSRLVVKGADGAANGFVIEATPNALDPGLAALAWNPASGSPSRLASSAANAAFTLDGVAMSAPSNTVDNVVPGLRMALTATNPGAPTQISFADPASAITSAMQDLTSALNAIMGELKSATDPLAGDLARDGGARSLRQSFAALAGSVVMPNAAAGAPRTLADLGLATQRDGSFVLDAKRLAATMAADPAGTAAMFTTGLYGVYATIDGLARKANKASDPGTLAGSISRYTAQKKQVSEDQTNLAEKQEALRAQLVRRFAVTDSRVGTSKSTLTFLQNQIDTWNAQRG